MPRGARYYAYVPKNKSLRELLADNVKAVMKATGLKQTHVRDAARRAGYQIDQRTVGRVAHGDYPATVQTLEAIAAGLGVPPWQLLDPALDATSLPKAALPIRKLSTAQLDEVAEQTRRFREMSPAQRDLFIQSDLVRELLERQPYPVERMRGNWTGPHVVQQPRPPYGKKPRQ